MKVPRFGVWHCWTLVILITVARGAPAVGKKDVMQPDYTLYHKARDHYDELREVLVKCHAPMRAALLRDKSDDYESGMLSMEVGPRQKNTTDQLRLFLSFGEHGRELVTTELALSLLRALCVESVERDLVPRLRRVAPSEQWDLLPDVLARSTWKVLPMENVRGRLLVEDGKLCERRNGRGVDINRNWDVDWGQKEADYNPEEEFPGTGAFSEPETRMVRQVVRAFQPHVWTAVHSGMEALFLPWDHKASTPGEEREKEATEAALGMLRHVNQAALDGRARVGSGGQAVGYLAHGTATDYMYANMSVPLSMTWEIYGDQNAGFQDCYRMFNPTTREKLEATIEPWTAAFFSLLLQLPQHPVLTERVQRSDDAGSSNATVIANATAADGWEDASAMGIELPNNNVETSDDLPSLVGPDGGKGEAPSSVAVNSDRLWMATIVSFVALSAIGALMVIKRRRSQPRKEGRKLPREKIRREPSLGTHRTPSQQALADAV